jgi:hypothetical protein
VLRSRFGSVLPDRHDGFFEFFWGCGVDEDLLLLISSVKGEYGAATQCGGALCPDLVRGGSAEPGHFFCSSCILSSGSPTMWYFSQLIGGHRTMFCGCGIGGNFGAPPVACECVESLRASVFLALSSSLESPSIRPANVGVRISWDDRDACARCSCIDRTNACGLETAAALSSSSALRSRLLFSRCNCKIDIADRSAMASVFSLSDIATGGGRGMKMAVGGGGGAGRGCCVRSTGEASWAADDVGVRGDTGGLSGDCERIPEEVAEASLERTGTGRESLQAAFPASPEDAGRVSTRSAGMAARWKTSPGANWQVTDRRPLRCGRGQIARRPESSAAKSPEMMCRVVAAIGAV